MAALTDYGKDPVLDSILRGSALGGGPPWYIALYTTILTGAGTGTECPDATYTRMEIPFNASSGGIATNDGLILFPAFTDPQTIRAVAFFDDVSAGHMWFYENLSAPVVFAAGQQARFLDMAQSVTVV